MKQFFLALNDYLEDVYHDSMIKDAKKMGCRLQDKITKFDSKTKRKVTQWVDAQTWKEGNLWYYYQQRKIAAKYKKGEK